MSRISRPLLLRAKFISIFLILARTAGAQITITDVVNFGSQIATGRLSSGIAQGALFAVTGRGVGPTDPLTATFPLPTTDGLGGVTIQAAVSGQIVDCVIVSVRSNEVDAILPSATPLGIGTLTLNNNGAKATKPITVVSAAFGIFRDPTAAHGGTALAFKISADDGSTVQISTEQSAQPGQDVLINGTGLGAIASDETQSGVTDVPNVVIKLYVGVLPAAVVSAGRGTCCDGLDPSYPIPQGTAAWDVIRFTIPDGITGCFIPVVVQTGNFVSNLATISIAADGGACTPISSPFAPPAQQPGKTGVSLAALNFGRVTGMVATSAGAVSATRRDTSFITFIRYPNLPASVIAPDIIYPESVCQINGFPGPNGGPVVNGTEAPIVPLPAVSLDAGPAIRVTGPGGTRTIPRITVGMLVAYQGEDFGNATAGNYFDPGQYTVTATGGKDVGAFSTSFDVPATPFVWTNVPNVTKPIDRSEDLTIKWTGGIPGTQVTIVGGSDLGGVGSAFLCAAPVSAGQMTVPSYVLLNLYPTGNSVVPGQLTLGNRKVATYTASGLDISTVAYGVSYTLYLKFE